MLFVGSLQRLDDEGQWTGIFKSLVDAPLLLGIHGLAGDVQADRRVHGGPEKAIHHYPANSYSALAARFPAISEQLIPGSIGENISAAGWDERSVCLGDIFSLDGTRLQVSQPRSPCWKIDHRYATPGVARHISETGLTGWYYRVLETGMVRTGSTLQLLDRLPTAVTLAELWSICCEHRPDPAQLLRISQSSRLNSAWRQKLLDRVEWLRKNACA
jgi:MOSC domain-containing protein YiiM